MAKDQKQVIVEDAQIMYRNFEGKEGQFNPKGNRNFACILPDDHADALYKDGWNIKRTNPNEEGDPTVAFISIAVNFKNKPPRIVMISSAGRTNLTEETVEVLDYADIQKVDLIFVPYEWELNGKSGVKAYLKSLYVTVEEDELERKYAKIGEE